MKSSNPMLKSFENKQRESLNDAISLAISNTDALERSMTISGTVNKAAILTGIVVLVAMFMWDMCSKGFSDKATLLLSIGAISGLILAIITSFKPHIARITAPVYAICEGCVIGVVSYAYGMAFDGIVQNALMITILTLFVMLGLYKTKIIQATPTFRKVVVTSTLAIAIFYIVGIIAAFLGHPMTVFNGGLMGIGITLLFCGIAALNLILDFDFIEKGAQNNFPSYFEWYGGFTLLVTLVWLYLEMLRLLAQLQSRD